MHDDDRRQRNRDEPPKDRGRNLSSLQRPLGFYDEVRRQNTSLGLTHEVLNFIDTDAKGDEQLQHLRHFAILTPLVVNGVAWNNFFDNFAAALLAIHHFNNHISDVVPEIAGAVESGCKIKFTAECFDTQFSPITAARDLVEHIFPRKNFPVPDPMLPYPTSLLGAVRSAVSSPLAEISGVKGLPQISHASTSTVFDNKDSYPLFGRLIPSAIGDAYAAVEYLAKELKVTHLGVLFVRDPYGSTYAQAIKEAAGQLQSPIEVTLASFSFEEKTEGIANAVRQLKASGYRYFYGVFFLEFHLIPVMSEAFRGGIAGPGYFWTFGDGLSGINGWKYPNSSHVDDAITATSGSALILTADPSVRIWRKQTAAFMQHWNEFLESEEWRVYFESKMPESVSSLQLGVVDLSRSPSAYTFLQYDAVIALALSSCKASSESNSMLFSSTELFDSFKNIEFEGAYSHVAIDGATGSRDYRTVPYTVSNIIAGAPDSNGEPSFSTITTHIYEHQHHTTGSEWQKIDGAPDFIYSDGTNVAPLVLPPLQKELNLLSPGARSFALLLCAISLILSISFCAWTFAQRHTIVIKASQHHFLYLLCIGTFIMGLAIIPMSTQGSDAACQSIPWLITTGFVIAFSALLSKMKRVNEMFFAQDRRRVTVGVCDVIKPFAALFVANLCVLISWTAVSPLHSHNVEQAGSVDQFGRSTESYTTCFPDDYTWKDLTFLLLLTGINMSALIYANFEAYRGRCIRTAYSESEYIGLTMLILLQAFFIGIPIMFVVYDTPSARLVVSSCLVMITCYAILLPLFLPKMKFLRDHREREERLEQKKRLVRKKQWMMDGLAYGDWASEVSSHSFHQASGGDDEDCMYDEGLEIIGDSRRLS